MEKYINEYIRPRIQGDGGEIEFVKREGGAVKVIFRGECSKCQILDRCVGWIEQRILEDTGESVKLEYERKKPYFLDK